jgi:hypothetical protein
MTELTPSDFKIVPTVKGDVIETTIKGISLVLFYNQECVHSTPYLQLVNTMNDEYCTFAKFDIVKYAEHTIQSLKTATPLTYTPYIVIYVNGKPYMAYSGPPDIAEIKRLIIYVQLMQTITASLVFEKNSIIPNYKP